MKSCRLLLSLFFSCCLASAIGRDDHGHHYFHHDNESENATIMFPAYHIVSPTHDKPQATSEFVTQCFGELCFNNTLCEYDMDTGTFCACNENRTSMNCTHIIIQERYSYDGQVTKKVLELTSFILLLLLLMTVFMSYSQKLEAMNRNSSPLIIRYVPNRRQEYSLSQVQILTAPQVSKAIQPPVSDLPTPQNPTASPNGCGVTDSPEHLYNGASDVKLIAPDPPSANSDGNRQAKFTLKKLCNNSLLSMDKKTLKHLIDHQLSTLKPDTVYGRYGRKCISDMLAKQSPTTSEYTLLTN